MDSLKRRFPRYSKLLLLYPHSYRQDYEEQTLQTLADMLDDPEQHKTAIWARTIADLPISIIRQQIIYTGAAMTTTPNYIKHYARVGAFMVTPFFLFVILNSISHQHLRNSIIWHTNMLFAWLVLLPSVAILINLIALLYWMQQEHKSTGTSIWKMFTDFRHSWPAIAVATIGLGILVLVFGHDSVHCVTGNPFHEIAKWHQTLRCTQNG